MNKMLSLTTGATIAHLLRQTLADHPPPGYHLNLPAGNGVRRLGHYLLSLGYITPRQLSNALAEQRGASRQGQTLLLGELLVREQIIQPRVLTTALLVQMVDRLLDPNWAPQMLGEHLVAQGMIQPTDLIPALQLQTWLRQSGQAVPLGELLIQQGILDEQQLSGMLAMQRRRTAHDIASALRDLSTLQQSIDTAPESGGATSDDCGDTKSA